MPGVVAGGLAEGNGGAVDWGRNGLLAYAAHSAVVVLHPLSASVVQTLQGHGAAVSRVRWASEGLGREGSGGGSSGEARLASGDLDGRLVVWEVGSGAERSRLDGEKGEVVELAWLSWTRLLSLHPAGRLCLWDAEGGDLVWRCAYGDALTAMDLDPFHAGHAAFLSRSGNLVLVDDVKASGREPSGKSRVFRVWGSVSGKEPLKDGPKAERSAGALSRGVAQLMGVVGGSPGGSSPAGRASDARSEEGPDDSRGLKFSPASRDLLYILWSREVMLLDASAVQTLAHVVLEPSTSPFFSLLPCSLREAAFFVQEHGCTTLRLHSHRRTAKGDGSGELALEAVASSDSVRVTKSYRVAAVALDPVSQSSVAIVMSTGRVMLYSVASPETRGKWSGLEDLVSLQPDLSMKVRGGEKLSVVQWGLASGLGGSGCLVRWRPRGERGGAEEEGVEGEWVAVGTSEGGLQLVRVDGLRLERDWAVHSAPVRCLEWGGPFHIVSASVTPTLSTSSVVRNEVIITDVRTGLSKHLRPEAEESPVTLMAVSFYHTYLALAFRDQPMEIWHLGERRLLRRMSKACPTIIDMAWSGKHHQAQVLRSPMGEASPGQALLDGAEPEQTVYKENLVVLDNENHLYHVVVKGMHVKDGKEVKTQWSTASSINAMVWKGDLLAFGDSEGRVSVWDLGAKESRLSAGPSRGAVKRLQFSRQSAESTLAVLHSDGVSIWNAGNLALVQQLRQTSPAVVDVDVGPSGAPVLLTSDGALRFFDPSLSVQTSPVPHATLLDHFAPALLPPTFHAALAVALQDPLFVEVYAADAATLAQAVASCELRRSEKEVIAAQLQALFEEFEGLESRLLSASLPERGVLGAGLCGQRWEEELWRVSLGGAWLPPSLDMAWETERFGRWEELRSGSLGEGEGCVERAIVGGGVERAVSWLLAKGTDSYEDSLLACLLSALSAGGAGQEPTTQSTVKLVATGLIAAGRVAEGTQLLCVIGKAKDAARYLQSAGAWDKAGWLSKLGLAAAESGEVTSRWARQLWAQGERGRALWLAGSVGEWEWAVERLGEAGQSSVAARLVLAQGLQDSEVGRAALADAARDLTALGLLRLAQHYAQKAGPNGLPVSQRLHVLLQQSPAHSPSPS